MRSRGSGAQALVKLQIRWSNQPLCCQQRIASHLQRFQLLAAFAWAHLRFGFKPS